MPLLANRNYLNNNRQNAHFSRMMQRYLHLGRTDAYVLLRQFYVMLVAKMTEYAKLSILPQRCSLVINPLQKFHSHLILLTAIQEKHADLHKRRVPCPPPICGSSMAVQGRKKGREYFIVTALEFLVLSLILKFLFPNE